MPFTTTYTRKNGDIVTHKSESLIGARIFCDRMAEMDDDKLEFEYYENLWHVLVGCSVVASIERTT